MKLLRVLLVKDLVRVRRKPAGVLIQIAISMLIVTMIGLAFGSGGGSQGSGMAPIKMAIVDEDDSVLTDFLEGAVGSPEMAEHMDIRFLERDEATELIENGELSAVLILPEGMTDRYLEGGDEPLKIELIKNPAQSVYPAIVEEGMNGVVTVLNAVSRNFREDLVELKRFAEDGFKEDEFLTNAIVLASIWGDGMKRLEAVKEYLNPPLVMFENETIVEDKEEGDEGPEFNLFSFIYIGLGGTFLLFIANNLTKDIYREGRFGTMRRFTSIHDGSLIFLVEKALLVIIVTLVAAIIMFGGSSLIFQFSWQSPLQLSVLIVCFSVCSAGMMSFIGSLAGKEKRADNLSVMIVMGMAFLGGGMIQADLLPGFIRENITPYLPTAWFIGPARAMQTGASEVAWIASSVKLLLVGIVCVVISSAIFQKRLQRNGGVG